MVDRDRDITGRASPHYWIVDPEHSTLTVYRATEHGYVVVASAGRGDRLRAEPFDAIELAVEELFGGAPS